MQFFWAILRLLIFIVFLGSGLIIALVMRATLGATWYAHPIGARTKSGWIQVAAALLGVRIRVFGAQPRKVSIWVSNHVSWLDVVALNALAPVSFIAKQDVQRWPFIGQLTRLSGTVFVDRKNRKAVTKPLADSKFQLRFGVSVVFFPEGTTSVGRELLPFKSALFELAAPGDVLQPVVLYYHENAAGENPAPFVGDENFVRHLWRLLVAKGTVVDVVFCAPLISDGERKAMAETTHRCIADELRKHHALARENGMETADHSKRLILEDQ